MYPLFRESKRIIVNNYKFNIIDEVVVILYKFIYYLLYNDI